MVLGHGCQILHGVGLCVEHYSTVYLCASNVVGGVEDGGREFVDAARQVVDVLIIVELRPFGCGAPHFEVGVACGLRIACISTLLQRPAFYGRLAVGLYVGIHNIARGGVEAIHLIALCATHIDAQLDSVASYLGKREGVGEFVIVEEVALCLRVVVLPLPRRLVEALQDEHVGKVAVGIVDGDGKCLVDIVDDGLQGGSLDGWCPPDRRELHLRIIGEIGLRVAIDLACRQHVAIVPVNHGTIVGVPVVDGVALHEGTGVEHVLNLLDGLALLLQFLVVSAWPTLCGPRGTVVPLRYPDGSFRVVVDALELVVPRLCVGGFVGSPIGVDGHKVATVSHIVAVSDVFLQPRGVGGRRATDAHTRLLEVGRFGAGCPGGDDASARTLVAGVLFAVLRLVEREASRSIGLTGYL